VNGNEHFTGMVVTFEVLEGTGWQFLSQDFHFDESPRYSV
jgi:hypothetical protein